MLTPDFREEWEEIQAEPLVIEGRVVEEASPGWLSQGSATFVEEDRSWLIAGGLIGE